MQSQIRLPAKYSRLLLLLFLLLSGCASLKDPEASQEYSGETVARLKDGSAVGQTIVSRRAGFNGVQFWLRQTSPPTDPNAVITAELYHSPSRSELLATSAVRFGSLASQFPANFIFPIQKDPPGQAYFVVLTVKTGEADIYGRAEDAYPQGELYVNGQVQPADAAFRTSYRYSAAALLEDLERAARGSWIIIPLLLVLWVPGQLILDRTLEAPQMDWGQRTALSVGMSLAVIPIIVLWTGAVGLLWNRWGVAAVLGLAAAALLARFWKFRAIRPLRLPDPLDLALMAVFIFTLGLRLIMARDLVAPAWVDPVHHSTITRLIQEEGRLPDSYKPYVETISTTYHPGFHTTVAFFMWLSGLDVAEAMLLFGQVQNALIVLAVYLFSLTLSRDRLAAVLAALAVGAFSPMPAYYLSWGRYTQLAGLLILPAAIDRIKPILRQPVRLFPGQLFETALLCAGLFLTHYRVTAFLALWLAAFVTAEVVRSLDRQPVWHILPKLMGPITAVGAAAILLSLPWWPSMVETMVKPALESSVNGTAGGAYSLQIDWGYLTPAYGRQLLWLAGLGLLLSIVRLHWFGPTLALWVGLLFVSTGESAIQLPLTGSVNKTSVEISLFLPIAVLAGYAVSTLLRLPDRWLPKHVRPFYRTAWALIIVLCVPFGARRVLTLTNPVTILARGADRPAMAWITANLPRDATVLINPFLWGYGIYAGQDGGYWITPLTGRRSLPPPSLYGLGTPEQFGQVARTASETLTQGKNPQALYDLMLKNGSQYVYLGRRGGAISPSAMSSSPLFKLMYSQDGVWVFGIADRQP